jgi:nicotinamidase-related amidase
MTIATVFVDMQVDFFSHPRLATNRPTLASNANALARLTRDNGSSVIWVKQVFSPDLHDASVEVKRGGHRIVIQDTPGAELLPELEYKSADLIVVKKRYSGFFRTALDDTLEGLNCKKIVIAGINTHACIRMTAIDAYQRDLDVFLAVDCIDSHDEAHHQISMRYMNGKIATAMTNSQLATVFK